MVAAGIAFTLGDHKDALVIMVVIFLNSLVGAIQEGRAESSLASLRKLSKLKSRVIRNSKDMEIEARDLVPGDIIKISAGDSIPSDCRIIECSTLAASEAALTGESVPVYKNSKSLPSDTLLPDRHNMLYAGTYITSGRATAVVVSTGLQNEIGKIAQLTSSAAHVKTQLEIKIQYFGKIIALISVGLFFVILAVGLLKNIEFKEIFMIAVSQMVSLVPEGLPVALTIALAVGVQRMAARRTIVRKLTAVESLGSTTIICSDKTGTLTKNQMTVVSVYSAGTNQNYKISGVGYDPTGNLLLDEKIQNNDNLLKQDQDLNELIIASALCNDADLSFDSEINEWQVLGDPTEIALLVLAKKAGFDLIKFDQNYQRVAEIPFDSTHKMMATSLRQIDGNSHIYLKGAPEEILKLADQTQSNIQNIRNAAKEMTEKALRVLAVAKADDAGIDLKSGFNALKGRIKILGLVGQVDPPRNEVREAVTDCRSAGIRPVMVTGDHKTTGLAIAKTLGIADQESLAVDGAELEQMSDAELNNKLDRVAVFARVQPAQKLRIVNAFQKRGDVVAMTGDGVNDAPALRQANVGVAMGITGTEVAKEASKIVITDDNFSTIVSAVAEGRLVYQNIKKLLLFLFVTSVDEVIILMLALFAGYPPPLAAVQILWINLVSEGALTINLIMEPAEGNEMSRKPVPADEPLLDAALLKRVPLMMIASVAATFGWFVYRTHSGIDHEIVQTETFTILVVCQWFNVLNCRSETASVFNLSILKNPWLIGGLVFANFMHFLVIYWPPLSNFFHTVPIDPEHFFEIGLIGSTVLWAEEIRKWFARREIRKIESQK